MITLKVSPASLADVNRLTIALQRLRDTGPGAGNVEKVASVMRQGLLENFATESNGGQKWAPLAERTVRERQRLGYGGRHMILVRTGVYRESFTQRDAPDHVSKFAVMFGHWLWQEGSADYRARFHELGTARMVARPATSLTPAAESRIGQTLDYVFSQIRL